MQLLSPYFIILCIFLPLLTNAQTNKNISIGSSLTAGDHNSPAWTSPSKHFAFGFQQVDQSDNFLLAIWFDMVPDKTITWSANRNHLVPKGSKVQLTSSNGLVLTDSDGDEIWNSRNGDTVSYGAMLDTGNFVLATQASKVIWQSFDEATDTMLPTQVLNLGAQLIARYSSANYSSGRFMIQLGKDGNLAFYTTNFPLYDSVNTFYLSSSSQGSGYQVRFNQNGSLHLVANNGSVIDEIIDDDVTGQDFYQRAILEYDGVLRHYVYPKNQSSVSGGWSVRSYKPDNICTAVIQQTGSGVCGFNSYCQLGNDNRPYCSCPPGYTLLDPNNPMGGCSQDFAPQMCEGQSDEDIRNKFNFTTLINVDWPLSDYEHYMNVTKDWCRDICLPDCFCAVSVYRDGGDCWKKKLPLSNGKNDTSVGRTTFVKVGTSHDKWITKKSSSKVWPSLFGVSGFIIVILGIILCFGLFRFSTRKRVKHGSGKAMAQTDYTVRSFSYFELSEATNGFKEEIGRGAFGVVYKGVLVGVSGIQTYIAVKKLDSILQDPDKEFKAEVNAIGYTHHKNLVRLIGFCGEDEHRLLVYEYMSNGTLADYLYLPPKPAWEERLRIAYGIARGLLYLHEDCTNQVIHCDIKPQNILLDADHNARISDFGLAKLLRLDQTQTNTVIRGTRGYVAPEWFKNMPVTAKVDVYSFGTLLLEIICCKKNVSGGDCEEGVVLLTDKAFDCYLDGNIEDLVEDDIEALKDKQRMEKMVKISLWCIQDEPNLRPTMRMVVQMLEGVVQIPDPPHPSSYSTSITR